MMAETFATSQRASILSPPASFKTPDVVASADAQEERDHQMPAKNGRNHRESSHPSINQTSLALSRKACDRPEAARTACQRGYAL
jgi:hypothetical protein